MDFSELGAVVTGGGRGIGAAVAEHLARRGVRVVVAARSKDQVAAVAEKIRASGTDAWPAVCDVTDEESVAALERESRRLLGRVDLLVNNAGIADSAPIKRTSLEQWNRVMAVNSTGAFLCLRAFIEEMATHGFGRIINVASITSRVGAPYIAAYTASKHAVLGLTRVAAAEYGTRGVTVNAVCPGYVDTEMTEVSLRRMVERTGMSREQALQKTLQSASQKRLITPEEVAELVVYLAKPEAGGVNGQAIVIDGGGLLA